MMCLSIHDIVFFTVTSNKYLESCAWIGFAVMKDFHGEVGYSGIFLPSWA